VGDSYVVTPHWFAKWRDRLLATWVASAMWGVAHEYLKASDRGVAYQALALASVASLLLLLTGAITGRTRPIRVGAGLATLLLIGQIGSVLVWPWPDAWAWDVVAFAMLRVYPLAGAAFTYWVAGVTLRNGRRD
jgi:hypothetical protein